MLHLKTLQKKSFNYKASQNYSMKLISYENWLQELSKDILFGKNEQIMKKLYHFQVLYEKYIFMVILFWVVFDFFKL